MVFTESAQLHLFCSSWVPSQLAAVAAMETWVPHIQGAWSQSVKPSTEHQQLGRCYKDGWALHRAGFGGLQGLRANETNEEAK